MRIKLLLPPVSTPNVDVWTRLVVNRILDDESIGNVVEDMIELDGSGFKTDLITSSVKGSEKANVTRMS